MRRVTFLVIAMAILLVPATASAQRQQRRGRNNDVRISEKASPRLKAAMREAVRRMKLDAPVPYQQYKSAIADALHSVEPDVEYGQSPAPSPEPVFAFCMPPRYYPYSFDGLCLEGRFIVVAVWDNPFDTQGSFDAYGIHLTPIAGYMWFLDPSNPEVVIKEINGCATANASHWIFASDLTNFSVDIGVLDLLTGVLRTYSNAPGHTFTTIIDQQTPFPCP